MLSRIRCQSASPRLAFWFWPMSTFNRPNGLSTLRRVLRRICRGHKSKVMLPTAVNRSRKNSNASTWIISNSFFKSRVQNVHMNIRPIIRMQVFPPHGYLFTAAWCCEGMKTRASTELLDNWQRRFSSTLPAVLKTRSLLALSVTTSALWSALQ